MRAGGVDGRCTEVVGLPALGNRRLGTSGYFGHFAANTSDLRRGWWFKIDYFDPLAKPSGTRPPPPPPLPARMTRDLP